MLFETVEDRLARYGSAGLVDVEFRASPFEMMTPPGFISDEGFGNALGEMAGAMANGIVRRRIMWLAARISRAVPYLGYLVIRGRRPAGERDAA